MGAGRNPKGNLLGEGHSLFMKEGDNISNMKTKPTETHSSSFFQEEKAALLPLPKKPVATNFLQTQLGSLNDTLDIPSSANNNKRLSHT